MKDSEQLELRKNAMKQSWKDGKLKYNPYHSPNFSKDEIRFGEMLKEELKENGKFLERGFKMERINSPKHYFIPDFKYKNYIIEFDGDFWHAHNREDNEIVHHNVTAKEIREKDELKNKTYEKYGYKCTKTNVPGFLIRMYGLFNSQAAATAPLLEADNNFDNSKIKRDLKMD